MKSATASEVFRRIAVHGVATKKQGDAIMSQNAKWVEERIKQDGVELPVKIERSVYGRN